MWCNPAPGIGSTADRTLAEQHDGTLPCLQAQGPRLPTLPGNHEEVHDLQFLEALYVFLLEMTDDMPLLPSVRTFILGFPISWTRCKVTLQ